MKKQTKLNLTIDKIKTDSDKFNIDRISDHTSYREFVAYFNSLKEINIHNMIIGINFVYGWMPTIFEFKKDDDKSFNDTLQLLNVYSGHVDPLKE